MDTEPTTRLTFSDWRMQPAVGGTHGDATKLADFNQRVSEREAGHAKALVEPEEELRDSGPSRLYRSEL